MLSPTRKPAESAGLPVTTLLTLAKGASRAVEEGAAASGCVALPTLF